MARGIKPVDLVESVKAAEDAKDDFAHAWLVITDDPAGVDGWKGARGLLRLIHDDFWMKQRAMIDARMDALLDADAVGVIDLFTPDDQTFSERRAEAIKRFSQAFV